MKTLYQKAVELIDQKEIDFHQSDLYLKVSPVSEILISEYEYKNNVKRFWSDYTSSYWFDIPFAFDPYWNKII